MITSPAYNPNKQHYTPNTQRFKSYLVFDWLLSNYTSLLARWGMLGGCAMAESGATATATSVAKGVAKEVLYFIAQWHGDLAIAVAAMEIDLNGNPRL